MISIHLSKPEARLCREAAKAEGESLLVDHGDIQLAYSDLVTLRDCLDCHACGLVIEGKGFEAARPFEQLAVRCERVMAMNRPETPVLVESETVVQGSLF